MGRAVRVAAFLAVCVVMAALPVRAQSDGLHVEVVEVDNYAQLTDDKTRAQVERAGLEGALAEAVRRVVGVQVQSEVASSRAEVGSELQERFLEVIQQGSAGRVVDYEVVDERWESKELSTLGLQLYYYVRLRAEVGREEGRADPGFRVAVTLNDELFFDRGDPGSNDEIIVTVETTQDAYLTIFGVTEDSVQVLFPNALMADNFVEVGEVFQFPPAAWRDRRVHLRAALPPGRSTAFELISVVATRQRVDFARLPTYHTDPQRNLATVRSTLQDLNRWLVQIPLQDRTVATTSYQVRRQ